MYLVNMMIKSNKTILYNMLFKSNKIILYGNKKISLRI